MFKRFAVLWLLIGVLTGCSAIGSLGGAVPTTGDTALDASAAQRFMPNLSNYGYTATEATSISSAVASLGGSASLLTGDPVTAALIGQIDGLIQCYQGVGAVAARIYTQGNLTSVISGQIPKIGVLAVINQERLANNFLQCALGGAGVMQAQSAAVQPCAGTGSFSRDGENLHYLYAATDPELCTLFVAAMPAS